MKTITPIGCFLAFATAVMAEPPMLAEHDAKTGHVLITEAGKPILNYNYGTVPIPEGFFEGMAKGHLASARKYAIPRSNYLHPLFGPGGEELTFDWSKDHAHHRGIYWAWPEVQFGGQTGDLHALQKVWARPTGRIEVRHGANWAETEAENRWMWEDKTAIVQEATKIRAWRGGEDGRHIDLEFRFEGLEDGVTLARRGTKAYGGLNIRLAPIKGMKLIHHADPEKAVPRMAWQAATGTWAGGGDASAMTVIENAGNPQYPADYVQYPNLPWFQPTFPRSGQRFALDKGESLTLCYRIWIRRGPPPTEEEFRNQWRIYNTEKK